MHKEPVVFHAVESIAIAPDLATTAAPSEKSEHVFGEPTSVAGGGT